MTDVLKNFPEGAWSTGAAVIAVVGGPLAAAYASLAWGLNSREKVITGQLEHHTTQLGDLDGSLKELRSEMTSLRSDLRGDIRSLSAEIHAWTRAFTAQFAATNARIDASNARMDATAPTKAA